MNGSTMAPQAAENGILKASWIRMSFGVEPPSTGHCRTPLSRSAWLPRYEEGR